MPQSIIFEYTTSTQSCIERTSSPESQTNHFSGNTYIQLPYDGDDDRLFCCWSVIIYLSSHQVMNMQKLNWWNEDRCLSFLGFSYLVWFPLCFYRCLFVSVSSIFPYISLYLDILYLHKWHVVIANNLQL